MTPIKSNLNKENCTPTSSNCVMWQGQDLPCIGLCTGDTVSDVIYKIAEELCDIKDSFGFTDVDLTCLLDICQTTPEPQKTLTNILNLVINKVCCLSDIVAAIDTSVGAEIEVVLASCFNILNPFGVPLTKLPVSEYVYQIGIKLCSIASTVATHTSQITVLQQQVNTLISTPAATIPTVTPNCVLPSIPTAINLVVDELENQFCQLSDAVGTVSDITKVRGNQCQNLSSSPSLVSGLLMPSQYPTWVMSPTNLAESLQNLWITVCDIRTAVKLIQDTCCKVSCDDIIVDFDVKRSTNEDGELVLLLFFNPKTLLPGTWYDCDQTVNPAQPYGYQGNKLTITDSEGHIATVYIQLRSQTLNTGILMDPDYFNAGYEINLGASPIDPSLPLTIESNICVTDGSTNCVKCLNKEVPYTSVGCCEITATGEVTITYKVCSTITTTTTTTVPL
jgi:hypothetical protein